MPAKKSEGQVKMAFVTIRLSQAEKSALTLITSKNGKASASAVVRKALMDAHPEYRDAVIKG